MLRKFECNRILPLLWDYAGSRLSQADRQRVARHLQTCAACRNRVADDALMVDYVTVYREQPVAPAPPAWLELRDAISAEPARSMAQALIPRRRLVWLLCGSAAAAGLLTVLALHQRGVKAPDPDVPRTFVHRDNPIAPRDPQTPHGNPWHRQREGIAQSNREASQRPLPPIQSPIPPPHVADRATGSGAPTDSDLQYLNAGAVAALARWTEMRPDQISGMQAEIDRTLRGGDDFVRVTLPLLAAQGQQGAQAAIEAYKHEKEIVDARLTRKVTLAYKAMPFREACQSLHKMTGIDLKANQTVADEKVTLFCDNCALRDVMRQITHVFGFVWVRKDQEGDFAYELLQDVRSRIAEEELRNRDRNAAVIALADAMERYRPYLGLKPVQLREASRKASGEKAKLLWQMAGPAWGGIQCYFNHLAGDQRDALFNDQEIKFTGNPSLAGTPLDPDMNRTLLEASGVQIMQTPSGRVAMTFVLYGKDSEELPMIGTPAANWPGACATMGLQINRPEPGKLVLSGNVGAFIISSDPNAGGGMSSPFTLAEGVSPSAANPDNAKWNRKLSNLAEFKRVISLLPAHSCPRPDQNTRTERAAGPPITDMFGQEVTSQPHLTAADVWEAVHRQTGMPIIADAYTRLYPPAGLTQRHVSVFDALCNDGDLMGIRWKRDGAFLQCRSLTFYWEKLKEIPERLLAHWQQDGAQKDGLPLQDVLEMAQLSDDQLDAEAVDKGVRECLDLLEFALVGKHSNIRTPTRIVAQLTPQQLDLAQQNEGLPLSDLTPSRQEEWATFLIQQRHIPPQMLPGLRLHLDYVPSGRYLWHPTFPDTTRHEEAREMPMISDHTAEGALAAAQHAYVEAKPEQIQRTSGVLAITLFRETAAGRENIVEFGKPPIRFIPTNSKR